MLDNYGLHNLVWNLADQVVSDIFVASPMDAQGRGIALSVRQAGAAANLTGATAYLVWTHRQTGKRGTTKFEAVDASAGMFKVFYSAAMCEASGVVDASIMLSLGDDRYISTRNFNIRIEKVLVDGLEPEDGFTLFVQAIAAYENATDISTEAAEAAEEAAEAANQAVSGLQDAVQRGDFDGADGFSPTATVTQTADGAIITITDKNGTTTADIAKGAKGDKGDTGEQGPKGDKGDTGAAGPQGIQGETGPKGDKGDTGATGPQGLKGETGATGAAGATGPQGPQGEKGETGATGAQGPQGVQGETGPKGETGAAGADGNDGISCTHSWNGTVLSITSASGTSSADLVGPQGPTGATGATGPAGADGTTFTPVSPLELTNGELSIDLSGYTGADGLSPGLFAYWTYPYTTEDRSTPSTYFGSGDIHQRVKVNDIIVNTQRMTLGRVTSVARNGEYVYIVIDGLLDLGRLRSFYATTEIDADPGETVSGRLAYNRYSKHIFPAGCIFLNTSTGNLMRLTAEAIAPNVDSSTPVTVEGLCNLYDVAAAFTASNPLSLSNGVLSIDLSAYAALAGATFTGAVSGIAPTADAHFATKKYVDDAVPAISASSPLSYSNGTMSIDLSAYALASDVPPNVVDATSFNMLVAEGSLFNFSSGVSSALFAAEVGDYVYDTRRNRIAIVTRKSVYGDNDEYFSMNGRTIFDFGKMHGIVTTSTLDVAPGSTGSGTVNSAGHAVLAGTLVLNLTSGNLMRATADAYTNNSNSPTVSVEGIANVYNANVSAPSYTVASPLSIDANDEISIDLSAYAALAGATFTGAVSGITPTANAHFATKGYVDGTVPSLAGYATESWVAQQINAAIAALDDLSEESF